MAGYLSRYSGDVEMFGCGIDNDIDLEQREREQQEIINSQQQQTLAHLVMRLSSIEWC